MQELSLVVKDLSTIDARAFPTRGLDKSRAALDVLALKIQNARWTWQVSPSPSACRPIWPILT